MKDAMTSTVPKSTQEVSVAALEQAMREIGLLTKPDQWLLIDPQGRMYRGTVEQMLAVLVRQHPLMRPPFALGG